VLAASLISLMMETASSSETLANFYQTTRCNNPEDSLFLLATCKSARSYNPGDRHPFRYSGSEYHLCLLVFTVWKGSFQLYLWHRSSRLPGCVRLVESHGVVQRHSGSCGLRARLLSAANGRPFWHQCRLVSPVSTVPVIKLHASRSQQNRTML
jgi:hypothetical protein